MLHYSNILPAFWPVINDSTNGIYRLEIQKWHASHFNQPAAFKLWPFILEKEKGLFCT